MRNIKALILSFLLLANLTAVASEALVNISVACLREEPRHGSELVSQQLMGFPVTILENNGSWSKVKTIDGYLGYIINNSLQMKSDKEMKEWRKSERAIYTGLTEGKIYGDTQMTSIVSDIVPGVILETKCSEGDTALLSVVLPDGRTGYVPAKHMMPLSEWDSQSFDTERIIAYGQANIGSPYLWGGLSPKGMDCSGMTWTAFFLNGRILPRDASKQGLLPGDHITDPSQLKRGDLMFFGNKKTGRINHVAIWLGDGKYIESSGRVRITRASETSMQNFLYGLSVTSGLSKNELF